MTRRFAPALPYLIWAGLWMLSVWWVLRDVAPPDAFGGKYGYDFRDTVWLPIRDFWAGHLPWDYPSYSARYPYAQPYLLYTPWYWWPALVFQVLPYRVGLVLWIGLSTGMVTSLTTWGVRTLAGGRGWRSWLLITAIVGVAFLTRAGRSGIESANWAIICAAAAAFAISGRVRGAALVLCLMLALIKPQVGLVVIVLCVLTGAWRPALIAIGAATALSLPIAIIAAVRAGGLADLLRLGLDVIALGHGPGPEPGPPSTQINLAGTVQHLQPDMGQPWTLTLTLLAAVITLTGYLGCRRAAGPTSAQAMITGGLAVCLVLPNLVYSTAVLIPGLAILAWRLLFDRDGLNRAERIVFPVAVALVAIALANTGPVASWLGIGPQLANFSTGLSLILLAVGLGLGLGLGLGHPDWVRGETTPDLALEGRLDKGEKR